MKNIKHKSYLAVDGKKIPETTDTVEGIELEHNEGVITHTDFNIELLYLQEVYNSGTMLNIKQSNEGKKLSVTTIRDSIEIVLEKKNEIITERFRPDGATVNDVTWSSSSSLIKDHNHKIEIWHYKNDGQNDKLLLKITDSVSHHHHHGVLRNEIGPRHNGIIHIIAHENNS